MVNFFTGWNMKKYLSIFCILLINAVAFTQQIKSPSGTISMTFSLTSEGQPTYKLNMGKKEVIKTSKLGIILKDSAPLITGFTISKTDSSLVDQSWDPVWGEVKTIKNNYRELAITLIQKEQKNRTMIIRFRLFNDGLGFRYEFPQQSGFTYFTVTDEKTEFNLTGDHKTFWIPGDYDSNEYPYTTTSLSQIHALAESKFGGMSLQTVIADNAVQTPLMMKSADGIYINIHEAALINYSAMNLLVDRNTFGLTSQLVPDPVGNKAYLQTPAKTPWRTIIVSNKATDILASKLILNLNEPSVIKDPSWIKPQKMVGVWWEMHVGKSSWNYSDTNNVHIGVTDWKKLRPNNHHGATTERTKVYIDFAAKNGFEGVLVEGWNVGWEDWYGNWKENVFDFVTPYPDYDVDALQKYAAEKGVKMIMHHETSGSVTNYERRMDEAYQFMKKHGYDAVKTGYVGRIIPRGEYHDGQWMVNHYARVAQKTADYKIMIDTHEPVRPTGLSRTYPNWLAAEAARGNEYNAWSAGNVPEHETILPFTRLMGGPMDYTPGIFQIKLDYYSPGKKESVHTTLVKQMALFITLYSPLQMAADLPENYERFPDAFQFIKDVAVDWDYSKILEAEPGDYITIARKAKNKEDWFIGAITDENSRTAEFKLDFLTDGKWYAADIYQDGKDAHWDKNPMSYQIDHVLVNSKTTLKLKLAEGGGATVTLKPAGESDMKKLKKY